MKNIKNGSEMNLNGSGISLLVSVMSDNLVYEHIILQDGGELSDNVLADLSPEVWEDFQNNFIDTSR